MGIVDAGGLRADLATIVPNWLANRRDKNVGFRVLWVIAMVCDFFVQVALEGYRAALPGQGTATALAYIGLARGVVRGSGESDDSFIDRLINWRSIAHTQGQQIGIVTELRHYLAGNPKISVINRAGTWTTISAAGTITSGVTALWDWDSISCPWRASYWSDEWVIVYPDVWAQNTDTFGGGQLFGASLLGMGNLVPRGPYGDVPAILRVYKAAHSNVRAIIWTTDAALFDFSDAATLPNGRWGKWAKVVVVGHNVPSDRNITTCRYWEPGIADGAH